MAKPIRITIRGTDNRGTDAPTVEDLLSQIQDFVSLLRGVEGAISDGGAMEIDWRVTDATKNSPLTLEVTPFPRNFAMNIDRRAAQVVLATSQGIDALASRGERPMYFSDILIGRAERMFERVTNGLAETFVDTSEYDSIESIRVNRELAGTGIKHISELRSPKAIEYRELGSIEGFITKIELDGYNRPLVWLKHRLDGQTVKCVTKGNALDRIGHYEVAEVLKGLRVQIFGLIIYKDLEKISSVEADAIHVFASDKELPDMEDIVAPNFTKGLEAAEYLRVIREDD